MLCVNTNYTVSEVKLEMKDSLTRSPSMRCLHIYNLFIYFYQVALFYGDFCLQTWAVHQTVYPQISLAPGLLVWITSTLLNEKMHNGN